MKKVQLILFLLAFTLLAQSQTVWTNIRDLEADPTGNIKCTKIINDAINDLSAKGGDTLFIPAGTFLTGPIILRSNITLWLDAGAIVRFSDDSDDYLPMVRSRWEGIRVKNFASQVYAYKCENISIRGRGHFEGQGQKWWDFMRSAVNSQQPQSKWQQIFAKENVELLVKTII
jgi:polygalacturonase